MKKYYLAIAICLQTGLVFAQQKTEIKDTLRNIELPEAVIRTSKIDPISEKAPLTITSSQIKRHNGVQDLPYLLNTLSSVVVSSDAGTGTGYTGIRIRGADLTRINVTMNGVPVNDAESQATYFVNMPDIVSSTKEIQISKGVGTSKNGTGSFGAAIAINNLDVDNVQPSFLFQTDYGSFKTSKAVLRASTGLINEKFITTIRLSGLKSNGYIDRSTSELKGLQLTSKYLFTKNTQLVFNYLDGKEKTGQAWNGVPQDSLETNRTHNELGMKRDGSFYNNQTDNYGQKYYQLFFDKKLNSNFAMGVTLFNTKGKGYYEEYKTAQPYEDYSLPDVINGSDTISETDLIRQLWLDNNFYGGRIYGTYVSSKLDAGLYLNYNQYDGHHFGEVVWAMNPIPEHYRWYDLDATKKDLNAYGMLDYRFSKKLSVFGDVQVRKVDYKINGFRNNPTVTHDLAYVFFNPKLKISWQSEKQRISLLGGVAHKEPNRDDVEAGTSFLPKPEKLFNLELNYNVLLEKNLVLHATPFLMYYKDQLVLTGKVNDVGAYTRSNVPESYRAGIELDAQWKAPSKIMELQANVALSKNKISNFTEYIDDYDNGGQILHTYSNTEISFSPSLVAGGRATIFPLRNKKTSVLQNFSIDVLEKFVGKQFLDNTSNRSRMLKSFATTDFLMQLPLAMKHHTTLNVRGGIYNLLNAAYEANGYTYSYQYEQTLTTQNYYYPQSGMRWMLGIGIEF